MLSAPSGGIPIASDTAHCGQKQILCAPDFCLGFTPTVCANMYTATDLCPASISRLHRRQEIGCTGSLPHSLVWHCDVDLLSATHAQTRKCEWMFLRTSWKGGKGFSVGTDTFTSQIVVDTPASICYIL
jgi:hypothetical protein